MSYSSIMASPALRPVKGQSCQNSLPLANGANSQVKGLHSVRGFILAACEQIHQSQWFHWNDLKNLRNVIVLNAVWLDLEAVTSKVPATSVAPLWWFILSFMIAEMIQLVFTLALNFVLLSALSNEIPQVADREEVFFNTRILFVTLHRMDDMWKRRVNWFTESTDQVCFHAVKGAVAHAETTLLLPLN